MAKHRTLYGWDKPKGPAKPKKDMPFKASRRHEYWSIDVRYIEHHQLPQEFHQYLRTLARSAVRVVREEVMREE